MPTIDTDYSCHIKAIELIYNQLYNLFITNRMGSRSHHIMPLVINSLGGSHTYTHTHTHANTHAYIHGQKQF